MKNTIFTILFCALSLSAFAQIRVISDQRICDGFYPQISEDGTKIAYLQAEDQSYYQPDKGTFYVDNEDLKLNLYCNGVKTILTPDGENEKYIWSSLSPDKTKILYHSRRGTSICDLQGKHLQYLGHLNAPVWYGNDYVVGMHDESDGHVYLSSTLAIYELATGMETVLTEPQMMAMYPSVSSKHGRIAYNTLDGEVRMLQLNLSEEPISKVLPKAVYGVEERAMPESVKRIVQGNRQPSSVKIYINPGHGGHDSDDRPMHIYPFASGDPNSFWESNSNLDKGLALDTMLTKLGFQTTMSRKTNTTKDDLSLSVIVAEANAFKADFMLSIHSNAGGPSNYILQLYAGVDVGDTHVYPTATPCSDESRIISTVIANNQYLNTITPWTNKPSIRGDKTFGRTAMGWSNGYGVLRGLKVPGTISEGSMHDYIPQTYRLMNFDFKKQEAWYFARSFYSYFCGKTMPNGVIGGQVRDANLKQLFPDKAGTKAVIRIRNSHDEREPIMGAKVSLIQGDKVLKTYITDSLYNGVFFFWDLTPGTYKVRAEKEHYYALEREIVVSNDSLHCENMLVSMCRETRPEVVTYSPCPKDITDSVEVSEKVILDFNWDMLEEPTKAAFSISPAIEGTLTFENSQRRLVFTPAKAFAPGVEYTVTLAKTACHPDSNYPNTLAEDFVIKFRTKNRSGLQLVQAYPANGATNVSLNPTIMLIFDAPLASTAKTQASKEFEITDGNGFSYAPTSRQFTGNTVPEPYGSANFEVSETLQPNTEYTLTIKTLLMDLNEVHILNPISIKFTTGSGETENVEGAIINPLDSLFFLQNVEKSTAVAKKTITLAKSTMIQGKGSNKVVYKFAESEDTPAIYLSPKDLSYVFTSNHAFGIDIYGDLSYNNVYAEFATEGDIHLIKIGEIDYVGWQHFSVALTDLPKDVDFQFMGIKVEHGGNILSSSGELYFDAIRRVDNPQTGLEHINLLPKEDNKFMHNGRLFIRHEGQLYDAQGNVQ